MDNIIERIELESKNGYQLALVIEPETGVESPGEWAESLTSKQIEAYNSDEWTYVSIGVIASLDGVELGSSYIGMVAYGDFVQTDEDDNVTGVVEIDGESLSKDDDYMSQLIPEALKQARERLVSLLVLALKNGC